jgi:Fe-S-cluster containining protein
MSNDVALLDVLDVTDAQNLPAGEFSAWLRVAMGNQRHAAEVDVPCGACTACCRASYFIHIEPDESATLARIPAPLLFPAPGLPAGHVVLGHDEDGHCPMLVDDQCSIYDHRPRTCRSFDCRVFSAAGLEPTQADMRARTQRWRFDYADDRARLAHAAVRAASRFLRAHAQSFPHGIPGSPAQLADLSLRVHEVFLTANDAAAASGQKADVAQLIAAVIAVGSSAPDRDRGSG